MHRLTPSQQAHTRAEEQWLCKSSQSAANDTEQVHTCMSVAALGINQQSFGECHEETSTNRSAFAVRQTRSAYIFVTATIRKAWRETHTEHLGHLQHTRSFLEVLRLGALSLGQDHEFLRDNLKSIPAWTRYIMACTLSDLHVLNSEGGVDTLCRRGQALCVTIHFHSREHPALTMSPRAVKHTPDTENLMKRWHTSQKILDWMVSSHYHWE